MARDYKLSKELLAAIKKALTESWRTVNQTRAQIGNAIRQYTYPIPLYEDGTPVKMGERPGIRTHDGSVRFLAYPMTGIAYWPDEEYIELIADWEHEYDCDRYTYDEENGSDSLTISWDERLVLNPADDRYIQETIKTESKVPYSQEGVTLNSHHCNAAIQVTVLSDEEMRAAKFTDHREGWWYYSHRLFDTISFNISIAKDGSDWNIDVLDEDFLQPYDFQRIIQNNPTLPYARKVASCVEEQMSYLHNKGIINGHNKGEYI